MKFSRRWTVALLLAGMIVTIWSDDARAGKKASPTTQAKEVSDDSPEVASVDARVQIKDVPGLPRVLIIGDSISLGYTLSVRKHLEGKANVHRPPANCGSAAMGIKNIESWLGNGKWDVIHFNWGLWDINRRVDGKRNVDGPIATSEQDYEARMDKLVTRLKKTGATLIWANTTYVQGGWGRRKGDEIKYNQIADRVMKKHGGQTDDLHALTAKFSPELFKSPGNVHFSNEGYERIAQQVADSIQKALPVKK